MTEQDEEETGTPGKPNAYWQRVREEGPSGFSSEFRGVNQGPRGGQQRVRPEDLIGDYDTCWCGKPADHDWPGKSSGRKHPKEERVSATSVETPESEVPHITNADLGGFSDSYKEIITKAVNEYRVRYRMSNRGIMLYPHDGSTPLSLPQRENHRTLKSARLWFVKHVADPEIEARMEKLRKSSSVEDAARVLAEKLNDPVEHPTPPVAPPVAKEPPAKRAIPTPPKKEQRVADTKTNIALEQGHANLDALFEHLEAEGKILPLTEGREFWVPSTALGHPNRAYETDGTTIFCRVKDCGFTTIHGKGASGHLVKHDPERGDRLWGSEAQEKKKVTKANSRMSTQVAEAVAILNKALGVEAPKEPTKAEQKALATVIKERDTARDHNDKLAAARDEWKSKYEDLKAKLDLLKDL